MSNQVRSESSLRGSKVMISRMPEMSTRWRWVTSFSLASSSAMSFLKTLSFSSV